MLFKFGVLTFVLPLISALSLNTPTNVSSGGPAIITWSSSPSDPAAFSIELVNTVFHNSFAVANNVMPSLGSLTIQLPIVPPGSGYTLEAVAISDINTVYSTSSSFSIAQTISTTTTSTSSLSTSSLSIPPALSSSSFGVTTKPTTTTSTSTSATSSVKPFNAASSLQVGFNAGSMTILLLFAVAGTTILAL